MNNQAGTYQDGKKKATDPAADLEAVSSHKMVYSSFWFSMGQIISSCSLRISNIETYVWWKFDSLVSGVFKGMGDGS